MAIARIAAGGKAGSFPTDQLPSNQVVVRYKGPFDYIYLSRTVQRWFEQRRFRFYETRIKDTGKKMKVDWMAERRIDEFFVEIYTVKSEMWNLSTQEIVVNGETRKILNGQVQFEIKGTIDIDPGDFFNGQGTFLQFLGKLYMNARWREIESKYIDVMEYRAQDIQILIKHCLNMTTKENAPW